MNKLNPFDPQNSATEKLNQSRARLRLAVFAAFGVAVLVLIPVLVQGCKREEPPPVDTGLSPLPTDSATNLPEADSQHTNVYVPPMPPELPAPTNPAMAGISTSTVPPLPPTSQMLPPVTPNPPPVAAPGGKYTIAKGDMLYTIAKKEGISTKALLDANPGIDPKHLKVGQEINLPAGGAAVSSPTGSGIVSEATSSSTYTVKSGDTLIRIAKKHGVSVKALKAANGLQTDRIKVGEKLKIPVTESAAPTAVTPPPVSEPTVAPPVTLPQLPPTTNQ
ncbi:MAG TPA: LysM peptidoglycan-binding domain-containing protein [Dongiaceae bacterium]|nr:LysM peptidoglycan-binding domain-containing protein [Dongiaceae bacterium]